MGAMTAVRELARLWAIRTLLGIADRLTAMAGRLMRNPC
jgi:hypothetical protein